jgi:hypothetical protein
MTVPNDSTRIARDIAGASASVPDYANARGSAAAARSLIRKTYHIDVDAVIANSDDAIVANAARNVFFKNPARVLGITVIPRGPKLGNASNFVTYSLRNVSNSGVNGLIIATLGNVGGTGNLANGQAFRLTVDSANAVCAANTYVGPVVTSAGNGIAAPKATWAIDVEEEGPDLYPV